jgi:hypothetical protein
VKYEVRLAHQAEKDLERLDRTTLKRIQARIDELADNPLDPRLSRQLEMDPEKLLPGWQLAHHFRSKRVGAGTGSGSCSGPAVGRPGVADKGRQRKRSFQYFGVEVFRVGEPNGYPSLLASSPGEIGLVRLISPWVSLDEV